MTFSATLLRAALLTTLTGGLACAPLSAVQTATANKPDTTAPATSQDQQSALKSEEKANKQRAKAAHEQRKALRAQDKAAKADKKANAAAPQQEAPQQ